MKKLSMLLAVAALVVGVSANAANESTSTGLGNGVLQDNQDGGCGALVMNSDGSYENGYAWQYGGVVAPDYGAFAEGYATPNQKFCSVVMDLTQTGNAAGGVCDVYAWADAAGTPGAVLGVTVGFGPTGIAFWPSASRHVASIDADCANTTWVGYWGNWPGQFTKWYVGADLDGFGGLPYTNIAPGIGYPTGWNNVSIVWGPTQAIGLGGELVDCEPSPTEETTWGQIKNLYK